MNNQSYLLTVDDLEMEMGRLRALPLCIRLTGVGSSSNEGKRGVSGGVNNLPFKIWNEIKTLAKKHVNIQEQESNPFFALFKRHGQNQPKFTGRQKNR